MSGAVSGAQFSFVPHANPYAVDDNNNGGGLRPAGLKDFLAKPTESGGGAGGREYTGPRGLAPIASGAFSSQDQALAFRHQGSGPLSAGAKNIGSWLFKSQD